MNYFSVDYLIIYAFLIITLVLGIKAGRGIDNIRQYAIGDKNFSTAALVLTLLATNLAGASIMNGSARVFSSGIIMTASLLACSISFLITGLFIAPKAANFDHCLTMGDLMKEFYGNTSGVIAGLLGSLNAILLVGMELKVLGMMCESLLNIPATWGVIGGGTLLALYTAHGGIKSVTITDIFQFIVLAVFVPIIAHKALNHVGGLEALLQQVPASKIQIWSHPNFSFYLTLFLMWTIPAGMIDPAIIQRLLMAKNGNQLRDQYLVVAAFDPLFRIMILIIGLSAIVLYPHIEAAQVVPHLVHSLLPTGLKGLVIAGLLAVGMSTIDSYLHAAGLTLVHDVFIPAWKPKDLSQEVAWARIATLLVSAIGMYIGLKATDILGLAFSALETTAPLLMFPLFAGMMGLKADKQDFYTALVATILAFGIAKLTLPEAYGHFTILISMATNGIFFFGSHVVRNKKFIISNIDTQASMHT
jgi:Na+/proline symporter